MKKLLSLLGAVGLVATSSATVVSCSPKDDSSVRNLSEFHVLIVKGTNKSDAQSAIEAEMWEFQPSANIDVDYTLSDFKDNTITITATANSNTLSGSKAITFSENNDLATILKDFQVQLPGVANEEQDTAKIIDLIKHRIYDSKGLLMYKFDVSLNDNSKDESGRYTSATVTALEDDSYLTGTAIVKLIYGPSA
jgi:hypothetical protein